MKKLEQLLVVFACGASIAVGSILAAWHMPVDNAAWSQAAADAPATADAPAAARRKVAAVYHVLAAGCGCSERVEQWARRSQQARPAVHVLVRREDGGRWVGRGLDGTPSPGLPRALESLRVAPWMIVVDERGETLYAGGYDAPPIYGAEVLAALGRGDVAARRGVRGCALSGKTEELAWWMDGKKWWKNL